MNEDELRDLAERVQQIIQLKEEIGWELLRDRAHAEIQKHQRRILDGRLDEASYRREAGWVEGALFVLGLPEHAMDEFLRYRAIFDEEREAEAVTI